MKKLTIITILINLLSCNRQGNFNNLKVDEIICCKSPQLQCIKINKEGEIKYADPDLGNDLDYESLQYLSYYVNKTSNETFDTIANFLKKKINNCKAGIDEDINYLGATKMNITIIGGEKTKSYEITVVNDSCIDLMNSLYLLFEESEFELVRKKVYFEGAGDVFKIPPKLD